MPLPQSGLEHCPLTHLPPLPHHQLHQDRVSLIIPAGRTVAFVGLSGSGKTTLVALLQRLYDPSVGTVKLDGHDVRTLDSTWFRSQLGVVSQVMGSMGRGSWGGRGQPRAGWVGGGASPRFPVDHDGGPADVLAGLPLSRMRGACMRRLAVSPIIPHRKTLPSPPNHPLPPTHPGLLPQDPRLFSLTVAENIAYGTPGTTRAQVERAAELANARGFIERLPEGFDTPVTDRLLSGGQRQRIAIARWGSQGRWRWWRSAGEGGRGGGVQTGWASHHTKPATGPFATPPASHPTPIPPCSTTAGR